MSKVREVEFEELEDLFIPAEYFFGGRFCPFAFKTSSGYSFRIHTGVAVKGDIRSDSFDFFEMDESGLIIKSPRGHSKEFTKKVRIINMHEIIERAAKREFLR